MNVGFRSRTPGAVDAGRIRLGNRDVILARCDPAVRRGALTPVDGDTLTDAAHHALDAQLPFVLSMASSSSNTRTVAVLLPDRPTSRWSIVSSPPTTIVGRRMRIQRWSILRLSSRPSVRQRHFLVHAGVEQPHDFAVDADRAGNPNRLAEGLGDSLGDARLAVAGGTEQEQARGRS